MVSWEVAALVVVWCQNIQVTVNVIRSVVAVRTNDIETIVVAIGVAVTIVDGNCTLITIISVVKVEILSIITTTVVLIVVDDVINEINSST